MDILWVKVGGLWPLDTGGRRRSFHVLAELGHRHRVTLLTTHGPGERPDALARALGPTARVVSVPHAIPKQGTAAFARALVRSWPTRYPVDLWRCRVPGLARAVRAHMAGRGVDVCVADFLASVPNVPLDGPVPTVLFAHNVEHVIWRRLATVEGAGWRRLPLELEWRKLRRYEADACARVRRTVAVSEVDRDRLAALAPGARAGVIPTGVDPDYFRPEPGAESPAHLVFMGSMDWYPNEDAVLHFVADVLPAIRRAVPAASFTVVGRNPSARLRAAAAEAGAGVTGTVEDVRPHVAKGAVCVVPLRVGGGTRLKLFEALAMGKAVVSTTVGAEGLPLVPGTHFVAADGAAPFADAVVGLLRDPARRGRLGGAGRRLVETRFAWPAVAREFEAQCEEVMAHAH